MAVVIETTLGDMTVDLFVERRPRACQNFLKLCKLKYYNYNLFHMIQQGFIAQTGDPTGAGTGGVSVWGVLDGDSKSYFQAEKMPKLRHTDAGTVSMVTTDDGMIGSQFFITLASDLDSLDSKHCVIGHVAEGDHVLRLLNETICDAGHRPYQDVRITHTVVLEDPFDDPRGLREPSRSPSPSARRLAGGRIAPDEEIDETHGKTEEEIREMIEAREAKARATILEIVGDLPDADMAPPENVLFVCKLNPVTSDDDLEIIFSRFGNIKSCEVIRDKKTGDSLQYAFIEFDSQKSCEDAYFKMDNVLIDDRRIHVDFSQSVSKIKWRGKGRGVIIMNENDSDNVDYDRTIRKDQRDKDPRRERNALENTRSRDKNNEMRKDRSHGRDEYKSQRERSSHHSSSHDRTRRRSTDRDRIDYRYEKSSRHHNPSSFNERQKYDERSNSATKNHQNYSRTDDRRRHREKPREAAAREGHYEDDRYHDRRWKPEKEPRSRSYKEKSGERIESGGHKDRSRVERRSEQTDSKRKLDKTSKTAKRNERSSSSDSSSDSSTDDRKKKSQKANKKSRKYSSSSTSDSESSSDSSDSEKKSRKKSKKKRKK